MFSKKYEIQEVFGQTREIPLNYVERDKVDNVFRESLSFNKHLVIYGSSKQGKTSLRKHNLKDDQYIIIHCLNNWDIGQLNTQILKQAGFQIEVASSKTLDGKAKVSASFNLFTMFDATAETEVGESSTTEKQPLELDPYDVNDIIDALESINFNKYIILEDFHYLKEETQKDFAVALKAFHENSKFTFVIVGVWLEQNRLTLLNGDLTGRVYSINADRWTDPELTQVITEGEKMLNIEFSEETKIEILKWSVGSVFITQEMCQRICIDQGILKTSSEKTIVSANQKVYDLTKEIINQQTGRYNSFLRGFYHGFQQNELQMHRWLLYPILTTDPVSELLKGITYRQLKTSIRSNHPKGEELNLGNLTTALNSSHSLQLKKNIKPNILDYDQTNTILNIVDRGFVVWLIFQDRKELLQNYELPVE